MGSTRLGWARCLPPLLRTGGASRSGSGPGRALSNGLGDLRTASGAGVEAARCHKSSFCGHSQSNRQKPAVLLCHPQIIREGELEGVGVGGLGPVSGLNVTSSDCVQRFSARLQSRMLLELFFPASGPTHKDQVTPGILFHKLRTLHS